jgi:hypothetical protein
MNSERPGLWRRRHGVRMVKPFGFGWSIAQPQLARLALAGHLNHMRSALMGGSLGRDLSPFFGGQPSLPATGQRSESAAKDAVKVERRANHAQVGKALGKVSKRLSA